MLKLLSFSLSLSLSLNLYDFFCLPKQFFKFQKFRMSFYLISDSDESWQRTLVYQTMYENYVDFIQQYKDFSMKNWITSDRVTIPKSIIDFVAILPGKNLPTHGSVITSGGLVPPQKTALV